MSNAREEIIDHIEDREVEFVSIISRKDYGEEPIKIKGTLNKILPLLDFDYNDGFGGQELYGYIWYKDGTWSDRGEYDGSEWWQHQTRPEHSIEVGV